MRGRRAFRVVAVGALAFLGLCLIASTAQADVSEFFCINGELFVTHTSNDGIVITMSLGHGEWVDGNVTTSCQGDRVRAVIQLN